MVGGGSRRDEGSLVINNTNVFAALESLRKKKKSDKERKSKGASKSQAAHLKESEPQLFWAPAPLNSKSWADVDDEDDDDYYATTAPPQAVWGSSDPQETKETVSNVEESESEEDILDEGDEDIEEEHDVFNELEVPVHHKPVAEKPPEASLVAKETERQLSKKERKKKELAELDALLANFKVNQNENSSQNESCDIEEEKRDVDADLEKEHAHAESKNAKKKKKKERASKEVKELPNNSDLATELEEAASNDQTEEDASGIDVKERLKKMATMKKKKTKKEIDSAAKVAAQEAAARTAKLAAAKKKEKSHYSQQPVR